MYYPYFRGKLNELIVVRDRAELLARSNIFPIIEPVKESFNGIVRTFDSIEIAYGNAVLIVNPEHGYYKDNPEAVSEFFTENLAKKNCSRAGILLTADTTTEDLVDIHNRHIHSAITCVHAGFSEPLNVVETLKDAADVEHIFLDNKSGNLYRRHFSNKIRVLIKDGFIKRSNKDYPPVEFFSDLHVTYDDIGLNGFGDYLIVGDGYSDSGGPAWAVAIHLTFINDEKDKEMHIFHFKSDRWETNTDAPGKFFEALDKLVQEVNREGSMVLKTDAVEEFLSLHERGHFPGLGYVKKLSMQHHLETLAEYFSD
jgi:hypothetical protein